MYALKTNEAFHDGEPRLLKRWVYQFLHRHKLAIRRPTRQGQKTSGLVAAVAEDFVGSILSRFENFGTLSGLPQINFVNMDETPVYFSPDIKTTVAPRGSKTVNVRKPSSNNPRITVC